MIEVTREDIKNSGRKYIGWWIYIPITDAIYKISGITIKNIIYYGVKKDTVSESISINLKGGGWSEIFEGEKFTLFDPIEDRVLLLTSTKLVNLNKEKI